MFGIRKLQRYYGEKERHWKSRGFFFFGLVDNVLKSTIYLILSSSEITKNNY